MRIITDIDAAWIAGFFDGEGCVSLSKCKSENSYSPKISITNTRHDILEWIRQTTGVGQVVPLADSRPQNKKSWSYRLLREEVKPFLTRIVPFIKLKNPQIALMFEYLETGNYSGSNLTGNELPPRVAALREIIHDELALLNKKGNRNGLQ